MLIGAELETNAAESELSQIFCLYILAMFEDSFSVSFIRKILHSTHFRQLELSRFALCLESELIRMRRPYPHLSGSRVWAHRKQFGAKSKKKSESSATLLANYNHHNHITQKEVRHPADELSQTHIDIVQDTNHTRSLPRPACRSIPRPLIASYRLAG